MKKQRLSAFMTEAAVMLFLIEATTLGTVSVEWTTHLYSPFSHSVTVGYVGLYLYAVSEAPVITTINVFQQVLDTGDTITIPNFMSAKLLCHIFDIVLYHYKIESASTILQRLFRKRSAPRLRSALSPYIYLVPSASAAKAAVCLAAAIAAKPPSDANGSVAKTVAEEVVKNIVGVGIAVAGLVVIAAAAVLAGLLLALLVSGDSAPGDLHRNGLAVPVDRQR